jgi:Tfp pilus assembly protein PilF
MSSLYRQILSEVEREIQIHPQYADVQNQFALLMMFEGELKKAERHFLEALSLNPKYREAIHNLGFLYIEMKRWEEAEKLFLSEAKRHPRDSFVQHALGILYLQMGMQKKAAVHIHKAIQHNSYYRDYYKKKGVWQRGVVHLDHNAGRTLIKIHLN